MARSVKWPLQKTARGGLALTSGTDQGQEELRQTIILAHLPGPSVTPWGIRDGVGAPETAFGAEGGGSSLAPAIMHSQSFFGRMERAGRAKLIGVPQAISNSPSDSAATTIEVEFEDLETGQPARVAAVPPRR